MFCTLGLLLLEIRSGCCDDPQGRTDDTGDLALLLEYCGWDLSSCCCNYCTWGSLNTLQVVESLWSLESPASSNKYVAFCSDSECTACRCFDGTQVRRSCMGVSPYIILRLTCSIPSSFWLSLGRARSGDGRRATLDQEAEVRVRRRPCRYLGRTHMCLVTT